MVKYKQSCVSLIVLAALMGVSQSGVAGKTPPGTPRANEEEDKKTIHRNPTNLKNLEAVPQDVVASLILPHLDARSALSLELTSYGLCQAVNKSHLWVATKEKLRSGDLINVEGVLIGHLTNPFCEKHRAHVKSTDDKTRRMVLFCSFRLAKLAGIVDKDCKELVTFVESLGEACEDVTTVMSTFVHPDLSVNGMGVIARVVHGAGPKRREICEAAIYLIETLKARSEPFYDKMAIVETMSQVDGDYMNLVTVSLENGLITQGVLKDRHLGRVLKTVHALGENRDKICPLAKEFVNEKDIAYKVEELLKNINTIVKSNADTDAILSLVRTVNSQL